MHVLALALVLALLVVGCGARHRAEPVAPAPVAAAAPPRVEPSAGPDDPADRPAMDGSFVTSIDVMFTIRTNGSMGAARARSRSLTMNDCMERVLKSLRLPKPRGRAPLDVTYTITFEIRQALLGAEPVER